MDLIGKCEKYVACVQLVAHRVGISNHVSLKQTNELEFAVQVRYVLNMMSTQKRDILQLVLVSYV